MIPLFAMKPGPDARPILFLGLPMGLWTGLFWLVCFWLACFSLVMTRKVQSRPLVTAGSFAFAVFHPLWWVSSDHGDGGYWQCVYSWFLIPFPITLFLVQRYLTRAYRTPPIEPVRRYNSP